MGVGSWVLYFLHIETLFIIGAIITFIYFTFRSKSRKEGLQKLDRLIGDMLVVPKKLVKKKKKVYKHENRCKEIFEDIFDCSFKTIRPGWLKNPVTKKNLELDGFNPDIRTRMGRGLAFEYDGEQHSKYIPRFHRNGPDELRYQMKKDSWKDIRCKQEGVMLIRIPYYIIYQDLERYIKMEIRKVGLGKYVNRYESLHDPRGGGMYSPSRGGLREEKMT